MTFLEMLDGIKSGKEDKYRRTVWEKGVYVRADYSGRNVIAFTGNLIYVWVPTEEELDATDWRKV